MGTADLSETHRIHIEMSILRLIVKEKNRSTLSSESE